RHQDEAERHHVSGSVRRPLPKGQQRLQDAEAHDEPAQADEPDLKALGPEQIRRSPSAHGALSVLGGYNSTSGAARHGTGVSRPLMAMFDTLTGRLNAVFKKLRSRGKLHPKQVEAALADMRTALLEADV